MRTIAATLFAICCLFLSACSDRVVIGDNGELPEVDAGQDAADEQTADVNVQPDAAPDVQPDALPDAPPPMITVQIDPSLQNTPVEYQERFEEMLRLTLVGDENVNATVTRLKFTRQGMGPNSDIKLLFIGDQNYHGFTLDEPTLDQATGTVEFTGLAIAVPAKAQVMVRLVVKLDGSVGAQHAFAVEASTDMDVQAPVQVSGTFPVQGPMFVLGTVWTPELEYSFDGPSAPPDAHVGAQGVSLYEFSATALNRRMHVNNWNLFLTSKDGGVVRGSAGTFCWDNFRVLDQNDKVITDIVALGTKSIANGADAAYFGIPPLMDSLQPGVPAHFRIVADASSTEDAAGECFGHSYEMALKLPGFPTDVLDMDYADQLDPGQITPQSDIDGNATKLVSP